MSDGTPARAVDGAKVVAAADALELGILKNVQDRLAAGKSVGHGDLETVRKIREKYMPPEAQDLAAVLAARPGFEPRALRWTTVADVAGELGVSEFWLRNWIKGVKACTPPLPAHKEGRAWKIQPAVAYEHLLKHAAKGSPKMRAPAGWVPDSAAAAAPANPFGDLDMPDDPHQLLTQIYRDKQLLLSLSEAKIRAIVAGAAELGRERERSQRMEGAIKADKVLDMLRAIVAVFANLIHERATSRAQGLLKLVRSEFGIDLSRTHPGAIGVLADFLRGQGQDEIHALHEELKSQCQGVRLTDLEPPAPSEPPAPPEGLP